MFRLIIRKIPNHRNHPELSSMQSDFSGEINELPNLIEMNRPEIVSLAANTGRVDCRHRGITGHNVQDPDYPVKMQIQSA